ncbi:hypothetical protein MFLAVUS_007666 [Mucor flavus]|uniref:Chromo domain-containing protein n=1 Tax=Mucor flavus TaxID=439312 RepID=A0ABP9Z4X8_9FUNG
MDEYHSTLDKKDLDLYKKLLQNEIDKIILNEWEFLNENWMKVHNSYKLRTELKHIKEIKEIKKELLDKLGYTAIFFFLTKLYTNKEYPSPYFEVEKGLYVIYHLISGITNQCLQNMSSNIKIRVYSAKIKNPEKFKNITLLLDGHDSTIGYSKPDISTQKSGLRTQVLADVNDMVTAVSNSELCGVSSDGETILEHKLNNNSEYLFFVKWEGYDSKDNTWVNEKDLNSKDLIKQYFINKNIKYQKIKTYNK